MKIPAVFRQPGFLDLLCDAAFQLRLSRKAEDAYTKNRHARSSIVASVFSVESCANCLLDSLNLRAALNCDIERLPTLSKFEACLRMSSSTVQLDRGRIEVGRISELISARNEFVHPKIENIEAELDSFEDGGEVMNWPMHMSPGLRNMTALPKVSLFWNAEHAAGAFGAVADFLTYVFDDLLKADLQEVRKMLFHRTEATLNETTILIESYYEEFQSELSNAMREGFNLAFLGFAPPTNPRMTNY